MSLRFQRLLIILISLILITAAIILILYNAKENISYFYTPSELNNSLITSNQNLRLGGFVEKNSLIKISSSSFEFFITDNSKSIKVKYSGILPDLFREGQGVICEGKLDVNGIFIAERILAKHDENYMPPEVADALKKTGNWKGEE